MALGSLLQGSPGAFRAWYHSVFRLCLFFWNRPPLYGSKMACNQVHILLTPFISKKKELPSFRIWREPLDWPGLGHIPIPEQHNVTRQLTPGSPAPAGTTWIVLGRGDSSGKTRMLLLAREEGTLASQQKQLLLELGRLGERWKARGAGTCGRARPPLGPCPPSQTWTWPSSSRRTRCSWTTTTCSLCCTWRSSITARSTKVCLAFTRLLCSYWSLSFLLPSTSAETI